MSQLMVFGSGDWDVDVGVRREPKIGAEAKGEEREANI
jgi:hypothetical protein